MKFLRRREFFLLGGIFSKPEIDEESFKKFAIAEGLYIKDDWERVKSIFRKDDFGNYHPELENAVRMAQIGLFVGGLFGGTIHSTEAINDFISNNDMSKFYKKQEAYRNLFNANVKEFTKGAFIWGPKFAIFLGGYSLFSSCCELYRNKSGIIENTIAGAGIGALFKINFGYKGIISGAVIGGILGTIGGFLLLCVSKICNMNKFELKYISHAVAKNRESNSKKFVESLKGEQKDAEVSHIPDHIQDPLSSMIDKFEENEDVKSK